MIHGPDGDSCSGLFYSIVGTSQKKE